jgi:hypothetical protein
MKGKQGNATKIVLLVGIVLGLGLAYALGSQAILLWYSSHGNVGVSPDSAQTNR